MDLGQIRIRQASAADADEIRRLLHAVSRLHSWTQRDQEPGEFYLLQHGDRLAAVVRGQLRYGRPEVYWVAVHPMLPEAAVREGLAGILSGVLAGKGNQAAAVETLKSRQGEPPDAGGAVDRCSSGSIKTPNSPCTSS